MYSTNRSPIIQCGNHCQRYYYRTASALTERRGSLQLSSRVVEQTAEVEQHASRLLSARAALPAKPWPDYLVELTCCAALFQACFLLLGLQLRRRHVSQLPQPVQTQTQEVLSSCRRLRCWRCNGGFWQ